MSRNIPEIIERQLALWREERRQRELLLSRVESDERPKAIVISYAHGVDGEAIAERIAKHLELPHYDHEIVEHIASTARVHLETVESLDQHVQGRMDEYLTALFHERNFDRSDYLRLLGRTVVAFWEHGPCVLSGHAAVHFVPREHALTVRLTAPFDTRARQLAQNRQIELSQAQRELRRADAEREALHRRFFDESVEDVGHFDLVVDTSRLDDEAIATLLSQAYRLRFGVLTGAGQ